MQGREGNDTCPGSLILYADNDNQIKITQVNKSPKWYTDVEGKDT